MLRTFRVLLLLLAATAPIFAQAPGRDATRELLRATLNGYGPTINMAFHQSDKQPYNFVGTFNTGLKNTDYLEVVIAVSVQNTISVGVFPHYKGKYVNVDKVKDSLAFMHKLLYLSFLDFLFSGADESGDVFFGYNFTLESGYPEAAMRTVLKSVKSVDGFVGKLRPEIDGSEAAP